MKIELPKRKRDHKSMEISSFQRIELLPRWPSLEAKRWVEAFVRTACSDRSLAAVVLLGSVVRPVEQVNDLDVLYICDKRGVNRPRRPIDVDLRIYSRDEVRHLLSKGHDLLGWALHFGYLVCEQDRYWTSLREDWLDRLALPDPRTAEERARKADEMYRSFCEMGDIDAAKEQLLTKLTHQARAKLLLKSIYPKSRPELPEQLYSIGEIELAHSLSDAIRERDSESSYQ